MNPIEKFNKEVSENVFNLGKDLDLQALSRGGS